MENAQKRQEKKEETKFGGGSGWGGAGRKRAGKTAMEKSMT